MDKLGYINTLYRDANVLDTEYTADGAVVKAICDSKTAGQLAKFIKTV